METLVLENKYKSVVPLFNRHNNFILIRSLSTVPSPTENSRIQGLFKLFSDFPVLFKADLIFKDFSRKPSKLKYFSSLCEP